MFDTKFVEYDFIIYMEPCVVLSYVDTITVGTIEYFIGEPSFTDGPYAFEQSP